MIKVLVIGKTGQLARAIAKVAHSNDFDLTFLDRSDCDLSADPDTLQQILSTPIHKADIVLIAAAYTAVDQAEKDSLTAFAVNADAPGVIAGIAKQANIPVIYVSTDYVFDGRARCPYLTTSPIAPLNTYGRSKAKGEARVRLGQPRSAIIRTSWVYDVTSRNFLTTMMRLAETRDTISVVSDQIGRPTYAGDLAKACLHIAERLYAREELASGTFHVTNAGDPVSWAGFARAIFAITQNEKDNPLTVVDITSSEYPTLAERPLYSVLDLSQFEKIFDWRLPAWETALGQALKSTDIS